MIDGWEVWYANNDSGINDIGNSLRKALNLYILMIITFCSILTYFEKSFTKTTTFSGLKL